MKKNDSKRLPAGVTKETANEVKAANILAVNVPESTNTKGDKKGGPKMDANLIEQNSATISAISLGSEIVFDAIRRYSGIILPAIYDKTAAAGLLKSKAEKSAIIDAAIVELQKAATIEAVCKCIERADKKAAKIEAEKEKAAKKAAERKAEKETAKALKKAAVLEAKKAAKLSPDAWKAKEAAEIAAMLEACGVPAEIAAVKAAEKAAEKYASLCSASTDCK